MKRGDRMTCGSIIRENGAYLIECQATDDPEFDDNPIYSAASSKARARQIMKEGTDALGWRGAIRWKPHGDPETATLWWAEREAPPELEWDAVAEDYV